MFTMQTSQTSKKRRRDEDTEATGLDYWLSCFEEKKAQEIREKVNANKDISSLFQQSDCLDFLKLSGAKESANKGFKSLMELLIAMHDMGFCTPEIYADAWNRFKLMFPMRFMASDKIDDFLRVLIAQVYFDVWTAKWLDKTSHLAIIELFNAYPKQSFELLMVGDYFLLGGSEIERFAYFVPYIEHMAAISLWVRVMCQLQRVYNKMLPDEDREKLIPKLIKYHHYLPWITGYLQQFIPKSVPKSVPVLDDEDSSDEYSESDLYIDPDQITNGHHSDGRIKDECMHDQRIIAYGLDKAIEMIERRKAIFAGFHQRTGARSLLRLLATRSSLFDRQVMRLPLQLAAGIKQPQISEKARDSTPGFLLK